LAIAVSELRRLGTLEAAGLIEAVQREAIRTAESAG
jgi:hypothetical protein